MGNVAKRQTKIPSSTIPSSTQLLKHIDKEDLWTMDVR